MSGDLDELAGRLQTALSDPVDVELLVELMAPDVTWNDCAGRDEVAAFLSQAVTFVSSPEVSINAAEDRLLSRTRFTIGNETHEANQAVFVKDGKIVEILDGYESQDAALQASPIGSLSDAAARKVSLSSIAPVLPVSNVARALEHYEKLGFTVESYGGDSDYGFANRDGISLHLVGMSGLKSSENTSAVYLYVDDADALYSQWRQASVDGKLIAPVNSDYGLREGAHIDADGNLLRFGSPA